jgi:hypothetical protein
LAESTLAVTFAELESTISSFLGYGLGPNYGDQPWTNEQQVILDRLTKEAIHQVYVPPPLVQGGSPYDWSFLHPTAQADFPAGATLIQMPDDFGGFEGMMTLLSTAVTAQPWRIEWRNEGQLRAMFSQSPSITGPPMYAAPVWLKPISGTAGQRQAVLMFPAADQDYTLQFQYYLLPDFLSGAFPYVYGGAAHASLFKESALSIAEQWLDDEAGIHEAKFKERLAASIGMDRKSKPQKVGYNADRSDRPGFDRTLVHIWAPAATYNGQPFN